MKISNFENPTWRTAAILKIVISPYLSRESSEYDEIWCVDANFWPRWWKWQKLRNSQIQDGGRTPYWKSSLGYISAPYCPIKTKFGICLLIIARIRRLGDENVQFRKPNMADGRHFWKSLYLHISIANRPNCTKFSMQTEILPQATETTKSEIRKFKMADGRGNPYPVSWRSVQGSKKKEKRQKHAWGEHFTPTPNDPPSRTLFILCMWGGVTDVITRAKFHLHRFTSFGSTGVEIHHFP